MATVPITVVINGQSYFGTADVPTVKIPELVAFLPPWNPDNVFAIWDVEKLKTLKLTVEQFRQYLIEGPGVGVENPPLLQGDMVEITIAEGNAPYSEIPDVNAPEGAWRGRYRVNVPELANQFYTLHRRNVGPMKIGEWLALPSGGFNIIPSPENAGAELKETFFAAIYNFGMSGPPVPVPPPSPVCVPVAIQGVVTLPNGQVGVPYNYSITLTGTQAFAISNEVKPAGISITPQNNSVNITGTPTAAADNFAVSFRITNACGFVDVSDTINIIPAVEAPPAGAQFIIVAEPAGTSIFAYCQNGSGQIVPAPFTTQILVNFSYTEMGNSTPVADSREVTLEAGQSQVGVFTGIAINITSAAVSSVVPSTNGVDTYSY